MSSYVLVNLERRKGETVEHPWRFRITILRRLGFYLGYSMSTLTNYSALDISCNVFGQGNDSWVTRVVYLIASVSDIHNRLPITVSLCLPPPISQHPSVEFGDVDYVVGPMHEKVSLISNGAIREI